MEVQTYPTNTEDLREDFEALKGYDFNEFRNKALSSSVVAGPAIIDREHFVDTLADISEVICFLQESIRENRISLLTGAPRSGKTSVLKYIKGYREDRGIVTICYQNYDLVTTNLLMERTEGPVSKLFLDEFEPTEENMRVLREFLGNEDRRDCKVVIDIPLEVFDDFRRKADSIKYQSTIYPIIAYEQVVQYISSLLEIKADDPMTILLAKLSGGSLFILHVIIDNFKYYDGELDLIGLLAFLSQCKEMLSQNFTEWDELRENLSPDLTPYVPNPVLARLDFYKLRRELSS